MRGGGEVLAEIAEPAEEIINLNNQINLCETHIPFCGICAVCERIDSFSVKNHQNADLIGIFTLLALVLCTIFAFIFFDISHIICNVLKNS